MGDRALRIATIRGIDIRIHITWLFIAALITWSFWSRFTLLRDYDGGVALAMALVCAVLFFASILVHELAHALEAMHRGVHVGGITLFLFGGATESKFDVRRPRDELALTAVGPFSSFVLAALFGLASTGADAAGWAAVADVLGVLGWLNLALGVFNLLPGAPLDGGRILRAIVWWVTNDRHRALRVAANAGRVLGFLLIALGLAQLFLVRGAAVGGLWIAFIGWFLMQAATAEMAQAEATRLLRQVTVGRLVARDRESLSAEQTVSQAVDHFVDHDADHVAVREDGGRIVGVLTIDQVREVDEDARGRTHIGDVMTSADDLPTVDVDEEATRLLDVLEPKTKVVLATDDGEPVGVIGAEQVATAVRRRADLDAGRRRTAA